MNRLLPLSLLAAVVSVALPPPAAIAAKPPKVEPPRHAEDLFVVHCLLPAPLRRLGRYATIEGARRVVKTSAEDCRVRGGEYGADRGDELFALRVWLEAARSGDPEAQNAVGELLERGAGGEADPAGAAAWYRRAADQGFARAQINLGHLYERGHGVERDAQAALGWYRRAAGLSELPGEAAAAAAQRRAETLARELAEVERELAATRAELDRLRAEREARPEADADPGREQTLEERLARYEQRLARLREVGETAVAEATGPRIAFLRPDVLATRGPALVPIAPGAAELELVGRVEAPAGLASLAMGEEPVAIDARGYFRLRIGVAEPREIEFVAVDRGGARATAQLLLRPAGAAAPAVPAVAAPAPSELDRVGKRRYRALLFANQSYRNLPALASARADAAALASLLESEYGFTTTLVVDATQLDLLRAFEALRGELTEEHDLLVYFAGHGRIDAASGRGFWLPVDADPEDAAGWVANELVADFLDSFPVRRALVVADSCYAGTLTRAGLAAEPAAPGRSFAERQARTALTSGGLAPVLDVGAGGRSIFARALLTVLTLNRTTAAASQLFPEIATRVAFFAGELGVEQSPEYAPIQFAGHEGGDFVFRPRARAARATPAGGR